MATMSRPRSGLVVLGMGKLGARELNYSSDIDLILLYDRERIRTTDDDHAPGLRAPRPRAGEDPEGADRRGYVFRTDLRLKARPGDHTDGDVD